MDHADLINGLLETVGAAFYVSSVRRLLADNFLAGIDWRTTAFFAGWGWWNMFYYPSLDQWFSFAGGCLLSAAQMTWVALALKYRSNHGINT